MDKKPYIIFLEKRLQEFTTLKTLQRDLENFETLCDSEIYDYELVKRKVASLIKNFSNRRHLSEKQSILGKELSL